MIGTPANQELLREAGLLGATARRGPERSRHRRRGEGRRRPPAPRSRPRPTSSTGGSAGVQEQRARAAHDAPAPCEQLPGANLALDLGARRLRRGGGAQGAAARAPRDDLQRQRAARRRGRAEARGGGARPARDGARTAAPRIIGGAPLGFANVVPRGDIGIVGASGTGMQEVIVPARAARRAASRHAIGTGGRDLTARGRRRHHADGDRGARARLRQRAASC